MIRALFARRRLAILGYAALATLPTALIADHFKWGSLDPESVLLEVAWLPVSLYCLLALLVIFGAALNARASRVGIRGRVLGAAFGVEILLSMRLAVAGLLYLLPALFFIAAFGFEAIGTRIISVVLLVAGLIPALLYLLRRIFATPIVLWQGLSAGQALDESARLSQGKLARLLWPMALGNGIALILEGLCSDSMALSLAFLPLSFIVSTAALAIAYRILTL